LLVLGVKKSGKLRRGVGEMRVKKAHGMIANWEEADTGWWGFIFPGRGCSEAARALAHHN